MSNTKHKCNSCGYVYDPDTGDMISGVAPGTPFEELPEGWICPLCGVNKTAFTEITD